MAKVADPVFRKIWSFNRSECTCVIEHLLPVQSLSWVKKWLFISRILTIMLTSVLSSIAVCRACACFLTAEMTSFWISEASWSPVLHTFINSWSLDSKAKKEGKMKYSVNESKKIFFLDILTCIWISTCIFLYTSILIQYLIISRASTGINSLYFN